MSRSFRPLTSRSIVSFPHRPAVLATASALLALSACSSNDDNTTAGDTDTPSPARPFESTLTRVAMRDGVELHTEVLLPPGASDEPVPTLLLRTPYDLPTAPIGGLAPAESEDEDEDPDAARALWRPVLERGYALVFQNLRGTQKSDGVNTLFAVEQADGVDTLDWIREQPWSDGRVGTIGDSAAGFSVHLLAAARPEGLEATFTQVSCGDIWGSAILPDEGGLKLETFLAFALGQSLELGEEHLASLGLDRSAIEAAEGEVEAALGALFGDDPEAAFAALTVQPFVDYPGVSTLIPRWREVLDENSRGDLASEFDTRGRSAVPGMHVTLWQDLFVECTLEDFQSLADGPAEQRLLVLDGSHYEIDDPDTWPYQPMLDWFDRHLKDALDDAIPAVQYAVQSAASVESRSRSLMNADTWPPAEAVDSSFYLDVNGTLSAELPGGPVDFPITADPLDPQATLGGRHLVIDSGVRVQPPLEKDGASAVFTSAPFESGALICGEATLETMLGADVPNVDLHARLVELDAEGERVLIVAGMQRARFRAGPLAPMDLVPGEAVSLSVRIGNIAHQIAAGSRLQLELTTSDFPAWDLNPQTSGSAYTTTGWRRGAVTVQGSPSMPARLVVPFLP